MNSTGVFLIFLLLTVSNQSDLMKDQIDNIIKISLRNSIGSKFIPLEMERVLIEFYFLFQQIVVEQPERNQVMIL